MSLILKRGENKVIETVVQRLKGGPKKIDAHNVASFIRSPIEAGIGPLMLFAVNDLKSSEKFFFRKTVQRMNQRKKKDTQRSHVHQVTDG